MQRSFEVTVDALSAVTAQEAKDAGVFAADADGAKVQGLLDAAQTILDGPNGWLGRAIGDQEITMTVDATCGGNTMELFYPPILEIVSVTHISTTGDETIIDEATYWPILPGGSSPRLVFQGAVPSVASGEMLQITYRAGYENVPERIKQAIMLMAKNMETALGASSGATGPLKAETVDGVGRLEYASMSGDAAARFMDAQTSGLLTGYRVTFL